MPYRTQSEDTPRDVEEMLFAAYRRMSPAEKLERMGRLGKMIKSLVLARLHEEHPDACERELNVRYAARVIDPDMLRAAVGWAPGDGPFEDASSGEERPSW